MYTQRITIILCFCLAVSINCPGDDATPELALLEIDYLKFEMLDSKLSEAQAFQVLGVGVASEEKNKTFDVSLRDYLPPGARLELPENGALQGKSVYGKDLAVALAEEETQSGKELLFTIREVPGIDCTEDEKCGFHPCDRSCEVACSVQFSYKFAIPIDPDKWLDVSYSLTPDKVKPNSRTRVVLKVKVVKKNNALKSLSLKISLPRMLFGTKTRLTNYPQWMTYTEIGRHAMLSKELKEKETEFEVTFYMESGKAQKLTIPNLLQVSGEIKNKLLFPPASIVTEKETKLSKKITLSFQCSASLEIAE